MHEEVGRGLQRRVTSPAVWKIFVEVPVQTEIKGALPGGTGWRTAWGNVSRLLSRVKGSAGLRERSGPSQRGAGQRFIALSLLSSLVGLGVWVGVCERFISSNP